MRLDEYKGKYVVAVSGGVDSVVLLDLLNKQTTNGQLELIVAHFDHGTRPDNNHDLKLVKSLAEKYDLPFYFELGRLGPHPSEQTARDARYKFLNSVVKKTKAGGLMTAHHQDDMIETAIVNLLRGTGRKGLTSIVSNPNITRPMLDYSKLVIYDYAKKNNLLWREDSTNSDTTYLRNYIRANIVPKLDTKARHRLINILNNQAKLNADIDKSLDNLLRNSLSTNKLNRVWFSSLDSKLTKEILASWLRLNGIKSFDRPTLERLSSQLNVLKAGKRADVISGWQVLMTTEDLALEHVER